jgi:hypothetical protein
LPSADDLAKLVTRAVLEDALQGIRKDFESKLPNLDDFAHFVTWAGLEDALQGIRQDWENLQQPTLTERVVNFAMQVLTNNNKNESKRCFLSTA